MNQVTNRSWHDRAACRGKDPALWFPDSPARAFQTNQLAKAICAECPVLVECRDYALSQPELLGVWGGMTEDDRRVARGQKPRSGYTRKSWIKENEKGTSCTEQS